ncbi:hypothetical protein DDD_1853 [Nonlabens dokdonensis DSW-6]|uniref:Uncharacterized protein n=2 Tax=Nonlabens dokdonensis TaxID=328515 RepID=L7W5N8_NONDD|nr:hypothetical protein DDD_1853 [Nonlabens dokdonensis DSW-6]
MIRGKGNLDQARLNSMIDFAYKYKTPKKYLKERGGKPFNVFWVFEKKVIIKTSLLLPYFLKMMVI